MTTRAQGLLAEAAVSLELTHRCSVVRALGKCVICDGLREHALGLARIALLSTLRKQHLRLTYFEPEIERRALLDELRIALDSRA
jgi:hypothetical protein